MEIDRKSFFFDVTYLRHAEDLRGIPQVILQLARLFVEDSRFAHVKFIAVPGVHEKFLAPLGVGRERVCTVMEVPWLGRSETFHGLFSTFRYRRVIREAGFILHPDFRTVVKAKIPQAVIYYDFIIFESESIRGRRPWVRWAYFLFKNSLAIQAAYKIAISAYTKRRALEIFPAIREESVRVLHLGARISIVGSFAPKEPPGHALRFLYVGAYEKRKNIPALLEHLPLIAGGTPFQLHLAGWLEGDCLEVIRGHIHAFGLSERVFVKGLVSDAELRSLYSQTDFFLFPSLFEGFGLPIVEAMAHGVVACAFENSCIPEIGGDAIILSPNGDFAGWARQIKELLRQPDLFMEKSRRARERSLLFSEVAMRERYANYFLEASKQRR